MDQINALHIAVLIISGILIILLLFYLTKKSGSNHYTVKKSEISPPSKPCPLCREALKPGETVHSVLFPGKPDSLMEIYGCPYCEHPGSPRKRICPVCKKQLTDDGMLIARVFEKPGKKHVHVLGCNSCYSGKSIRTK